MVIPINQYPPKTQGVDFHKFQRVTVDGYVFDPDGADVVFNFRSSQLSFSLVFEGTGTIEYSFNGNTVHGDMTAGTPTAAMFFDNRPVFAIWFRLVSGTGGTVRVEGWRV